jgi:uncharacterized membrane protein (DUF2068 family)
VASAGGSLLPWIVLFKAVKASLLTALGVTLLFAIHGDPVDVIARIAELVHLPVSSRLFDRAMNLAIHATPRKEVGLAVTAFGYAALMGTEGVGLYLRRRWARWFTIGATGSLIPIEIVEILRHPRPLRIAILLLNVAVVVYLFKRKEVFE